LSRNALGERRRRSIRLADDWVDANLLGGDASKSAPHAYLATNNLGFIGEANDAAAEFLGVEHRWLIGKPIVAYIDFANQHAFMRHLHLLSSDRVGLRMKLRVRPRGRSPFPAIADVTIDEDADATRLRWRLSEISSLPEVEVDIAPSLLEQVPAVFWTTDSDLIVTTFGGSLTLLDIVPGTAIGRPLEELLGDTPAAGALLAACRRALTGEPGEVEVRSHGRVIRGQIDCIIGPDGDVRGVGAAALDATQEGRKTEAIQVAFDKERKMKKQLQTLNLSKDTFLQAAGHDLRVPLTAVIGYAQLLNDDEILSSPDTAHEFADQLLEGAWRLEQLLADLLDFQRLSSQEGVMTEPTNVGEFARRVVEGLPTEDRLVAVSGGDVWASVDPTAVERIVENLVLNALKHNPDASVDVTVSAEEAGVLITVSDDGSGVPDVMKEAIFEAFRRGQTKAKGSGLGLSLVRRFAELHHGKTWVEDAPGGGAAFKVWLPGLLQVRGPDSAAS
jgi:signal transduction histidine kinase